MKSKKKLRCGYCKAIVKWTFATPEMYELKHDPGCPLNSKTNPNWMKVEVKLLTT